VTLSLRNLRLLVLASWALFLGWLWLSGQVLRYLGPRTSWVVTFGAITLLIATVAYARLSAQGEDSLRPVSRGEAVGLLSLLTPILLAAMLSGSSLGALAASKKLTARGVDLASLAESLSSDASEVSFLQIKAASDSPATAADLDIAPGQQVVLTGLVMKSAKSPGAPFELGRFYVTCCIADALPISVPIDETLVRGSYSKDDWLEVTGALDQQGKRFVVKAERIRPVSEPDDPYLSFR
jgi:putative membrane protein